MHIYAFQEGYKLFLSSYMYMIGFISATHVDDVSSMHIYHVYMFICLYHVYNNKLMFITLGLWGTRNIHFAAEMAVSFLVYQCKSV
jgi:hypothetical protein